MRTNDKLAQQLVHDLSFETKLGDPIKFYDKKVEIVENLLNKITSPKNIIEMYSKLEDDIHQWCHGVVNLIPTTYTDELGSKRRIRYEQFSSAELSGVDRDVISIATTTGNWNEYDEMYLYLPLSFYLEKDVVNAQQRAADYLYSVIKAHFDSDCEKEKQRKYNEDLAEYNRLKEKLGL